MKRGVKLTRYPFLALLLLISPGHATAAPFRAQFLGVTTILLDDGKTAIMTDGFFSRPSLKAVNSGPIGPSKAVIESVLARAKVTKLAVVLVAHSHHDHALDSAIVAEQTGADLIGSESTANIARGLDFPMDRFHVVKGGETFKYGEFTIRVIKTPHSPKPLSPGDITEPLRPPVPVTAYKEGGNFSFIINHLGEEIIIIPSANYVPGFLRGEKSDVMFLGIGTLAAQPKQFADDYWRETVQAATPKLVIPIHWDDFFQPLDKPLVPLDPKNGDVVLISEMAKTHGVKIKLLQVFETIDLSKFSR